MKRGAPKTERGRLLKQSRELFKKTLATVIAFSETQITSRDDEYGAGWNAAWRYLQERLRTTGK